MAPDSSSKSDWVRISLVAAKTFAAAAEFAPFPYVQGVFGTFVAILETVEVQNSDAVKGMILTMDLAEGQEESG